MKNLRAHFQGEVKWLPEATLLAHAAKVAGKTMDEVVEELFKTMPVFVIDGTGIELFKPGDAMAKKLMHCWFKGEHQGRFFTIVSLTGFTMYIQPVDIGHQADEKAVNNDSELRASFANYYGQRLAPDAEAEAARLADPRVGDGGTTTAKALILGDQGYVMMAPLPGCDLLITRTAEDVEEWKKASKKNYVRISSTVSKVRSVIERVFGRLAQDCPFVTGPIYESQVMLAHDYCTLFLSLYNRELVKGENLFAKDTSE